MTVARRGLLASLAALLGGCSPARLLNSTVSREGYIRHADIAYGPLPRQKLDLYQPVTPRADGKAVIFFYGGSWDSGAKGDYLFVAQALASRGITTIVPDYRLYPEVRFPVFLEDAAQATRWTGDRVGPSKLFVMGHSAGAHIALMLASNTPYLARAGIDRLNLAGAIGIAGPYDFLPLKSAKLIDIFGGADRPEIEAITFTRAPLPPALLLHGTADTTVYPRNSKNLAAAWRRAGAPVELKLYPDVGHIDVVAAFSDLLHKRATTREDVLAYIDAS
ncbi:alpha/beta hydrolase [Reyranella sp.]|uniref:alpha/beta hydrolase n=1 Tax=Reyranella sp. TaxID=1929291 RepID=UPI003D0ABD82